MEPSTITASTSPRPACWSGASFIRWTVLPLAVLNWSVLAQVAPPSPGAGQLLKQVEPVVAPPPATVETPTLRVEPAAVTAPTAETSTPIEVTTIELSGNKSIDTATLKALVAEAEGQTRTLAQLNALAQRVTDYYREQGQPLASAYLPEQTMDKGVLRIVIVEAIYGQIRIENSSRMSSAQIESFVASLKPGDIVRQDPLDRSLLLLRDLAGVSVTANARPGTAIGSTDLILTAIDAPRVAGTYALDNQGGKASGRGRAIATIDLRNSLGRGETFSGLALTSGAGMAYARLAVQAPVTGIGTTVGVGVAQLQYKLGDIFSSLDANGTATVVDGFVQQALVRSTRAALNADLRFEHKTLKDRVDSVGTRNYRTVTSVAPGLNGELRDEIGGGGRTSFSIGYTAGKVSFDDATAESKDQDSAGANTKGIYGRLNLELARQQGLSGWPALANTTLFGRVRGQLANRNIDSSEQISIAGPQGVRGYDTNALSGAQGYVATVELRQMVANTQYGVIQAQLFADSGQVTVYKNPIVNSTLPNTASMHSAGLGVGWASQSGWNVQLSVAVPIGGSPAISTNRSTRTWLTVGGTF